MLLQVLSEAQRTTVQFALDSDEWRRWHNTHMGFMRHGLLLEALDEPQRAAALALVRSSLSAAGFATARGIMHLNHNVER